MSDTYINIPDSGSPSWKDPVDTAADLPLLGNRIGDVRLALDTDTIYVWTGTSWMAVATPGAATAIDALLGDVTANGPGAVPSTVNFVGGVSASDIASGVTSANAATSANTPNTIVKRDGSGNFSSGTITANLIGNVTGNVSGSSGSFTGTLLGDVTGTQSTTSISSTTVTGKFLTGYVVGSAVPLAATDSILTAFQKVQGQLNATSGSAITALTGDGTATGPGSVSFTLATVNGNIGSFGDSTHVGAFTVNAKGLVTAASSVAINFPVTVVTGSGNISSSGGSIPNITFTGILPSSNGGTGVNNSFNLTISGTSSINGTFSGSSSGSNTGDVTLAAVGSSPNVNAASLSGQVLNLQPASASFPGVVTTGTQTFAGDKTLSGNTISKNLTLNGTAGGGFLQFNSQSITPTTPVGGFILFGDATNRMTQLNTSGFTTTYDSNGITANRIYTLRDVSGKFLLDTRLSMAATTISSATTTILSTDAFAVYLIDTTAARTINLPTATSVADRVYLFKDISGTSETNNITLVPNGTDKIENLNANKILQTNFGSWTLVSDASGSWWMI